MPWIESHTNLIRHRKVIDLARSLRLRPAYILGHLHAIWHAALEQAEDGDLSSWSDEQIATVADYPGQPASFVRLLIASRWLDGTRGDDGQPRRLLIHDWIDYAGLYLRRKYGTKAKAKLDSILAKHNKAPPGDDEDSCTTSVQNLDSSCTGVVGTSSPVRSKAFTPKTGEEETVFGVGGVGEGVSREIADLAEWFCFNQRPAYRDSPRELAQEMQAKVEAGVCDLAGLVREVKASPKKRDRSERAWQMWRRLEKASGNGKPGLLDGLADFAEGR